MRWKTIRSGQVKENEIGPGGGGRGIKGKNVRTNTHKYVWIHMHLHLSRHYLEDRSKFELTFLKPFLNTKQSHNSKLEVTTE